MNGVWRGGRRTSGICGVALLFLLMGTLAIQGCEPGGFPIIENQSDHDIRIDTLLVREDGTLGESVSYGIVPARSTKKLASLTFVRRTWVYRIKAVDPSGKTVFSHDYNMDDLERISWKIVVPPSPGP